MSSWIAVGAVGGPNDSGSMSPTSATTQLPVQALQGEAVTPPWIPFPRRAGELQGILSSPSWTMSVRRCGRQKTAPHVWCLGSLGMRCRAGAGLRKDFAESMRSPNEVSAAGLMLVPRRRLEHFSLLRHCGIAVFPVWLSGAVGQFLVGLTTPWARSRPPASCRSSAEASQILPLGRTAVCNRTTPWGFKYM